MTRGPLAGLPGLLRGELSRWVGRRGLLHLLVWTVAIQGALYVGTMTDLGAFQSFWGFDLLVHVLWLFTIPGAIAVAQSAIAEERTWGTDEWMLARPVTRAAYIMAKILGTAIPLTLIAIVVQGTIAYLWLPSLEPSQGLTPVAPDRLRYVAVLGVLTLLLLLFVVLCVMVGTLFRQRAAAAAISLVVFFLFLFPPGARDAVWHTWFPGGLVEGVNDGASYKRITEYLLGGSFEGHPAVASTVIAIGVLTAVAILRFQRHEI